MKSICVFCEGKTEKNYLQSLSRFLERNDIYELRFTGKYLEGVNINNYDACIRKYKGHDLKGFDEFYAWIDFDIFQRGNRKRKDIEDCIQKISFNRKSVIPLFNIMNGEDFMMLHQPENILQQWIEICKANKHFEVPMNSEEYMKHMKSIIPDYKKRRMETARGRRYKKVY